MREIQSLIVQQPKPRQLDEKQLGLLSWLANPRISLIVTVPEARSLVARRYLRAMAEDWFFCVTPSGLRRLADADR